ncbi:MAG: glycosyltransferase [Bryobacteraceae bacterium]|nr:glycosyltransferase [Bryobacteraceae bacterium]MDW8379049.1 glycosyltransferase [Bryobacterales bacterium]
MEQTQPQAEQPPLLAVSVLILAFNRDAHLRGCLQALERSSDRQRLQIIVLDPGSQNSVTSLQPDFPDVTILRMPRNFGATKALNIGLRTAKADVVFFLDPAVIVEPDTIWRLLAGLEAHREAAAVCPLRLDEQRSPLPQVRQLPNRELLVRTWRSGEEIPAEIPAPKPEEQELVSEYPGRRALMIRLNFLRGMNYFDEHYGEWGADLELAFQIRHAGKKVLILRDVCVTDRGADQVQNLSAADRALLAADRASGVARFLERRAGFFAGLWFRLSAVLSTLVAVLSFQQPAVSWRLFLHLLSGTKIDGSQ